MEWEKLECRTSFLVLAYVVLFHLCGSWLVSSCLNLAFVFLCLSYGTVYVMLVCVLALRLAFAQWGMCFGGF